MKCDGCGNEFAYRISLAMGAESCDKCGELNKFLFPDAYFDGKPVETLSDKRGNPMVFLSKGHKAKVMKERGIEEVGDKVHGAPYIPKFEKQVDPVKYRRECEKAVYLARQKLRML